MSGILAGDPLNTRLYINGEVCCSPIQALMLDADAVSSLSRHLIEAHSR